MKCLICEKDLKRNSKKFCSRQCYYTAKAGTGNHFYGKKHTKETIEKLRNDPRLSHPGEDNPFYGKSHTNESKQVIREKNRIWRENNKQLRLERRLKRKNLTKERIEEVWATYAAEPHNRSYLIKELGIDYRTAKKFVIDLRIETEEGVRKLGIEKQFFQSGRAISAPELEMLSLLVEEFGSSNVVHQSKKFGYYYDFLINDEVLVEYDGYYYHKVLINKNDAIKERLALTNGYSFVRVEEDENRKADFIEGIKRIKNELQTKENKEY